MGWVGEDNLTHRFLRGDMNTRNALSALRLRELLSYDAESGEFRWRNPAGRWGRIASGSIAGGTSKTTGYQQIAVDGIPYKAHRLAWLYMTGDWPPNEIDHINRVRDDNRFANLRAATLQENLSNKEVYKSNTSGFPGVTWHSRICMWQARLGVARSRKHLGYFDSPEKAASAYASAKAHSGLCR
jgi:hypothetical protein